MLPRNLIQIRRSKILYNKNVSKVSNSTKLLVALADFAGLAFDNLDAFIMSRGSVKQLNANLGMVNKQYHSAFQGLCKNGYVKEVNENQFLITPKGKVKIRVAQIEESDWQETSWDGYWRIISFDIPEKLRRKRDILRSILKRKGFIGIQNSVFIAPFADLEILAKLREDLGIAKYVSFFISKSYHTDDDNPLKERFNLK